MEKYRARIVFCEECAISHGKILFSDGSESEDFFSRDSGRGQIELARQEGKLSDHEASLLASEVAEAMLQEKRCAFTEAIESMAGAIYDHDNPLEDDEPEKPDPSPTRH